MCMKIDTSVTSLNRRIVWKVFDKQNGKIVSLFQAATYPQGKSIKRADGRTSFKSYDGSLLSEAGLYFYTSKARAVAAAREWTDSYVAKFAVKPKDFMFAGADEDKGQAVYERATRIGKFIKVER